MAEHVTEKGFHKWQEGLVHSIKKYPEKWSLYDSEIAATIATYDQHLIATPGYFQVSFQIVKAILWTETGAASPDWHLAPMQIGIRTDLGLHDLLTTDHGQLILPRDYALILTESNVPVVPTFNIWAGVGYLLRRFAHYATILTKESIDRSQKQHTSSDNSNKKASKDVLVISGWDVMTTANVPHRYNGGGDNTYQRKFEFCLSLINSQ